MLSEGTLSQLTPPFFVSLGLVIVGAVTVLVFAPKPGKKPAPPTDSDQSKDEEPVKDSVEEAKNNEREEDLAEQGEHTEEASASASDE